MKRTIICLLVATFHVVIAAQAPVSQELTAAWSLAGRWTGVVGDQKSGAIYALGHDRVADRQDRVAQVDTAGQIQREVLLPGWARTLRLARLPRPTLVTFTRWGVPHVNAYDISGHHVWSYPRFTGVDDVWPGDLDGDGSDEVVVGYNGNAGVHVVGGNGGLRWKSTDVGNVWHVAVGDVLAQGRSQVLTPAFGKIQIFNGDGDGRVDVAAQGIYLNMVRVQKLREEDATATMLVAGSDLVSNVTIVMALTGDGVSKWKLELPSSVVTADLASVKPWLALGTRDGQVFVVDAVRGRIIGVVAEQGTPEVGWAGDPPLLLVATGTSLNAFHVTPK